MAANSVQHTAGPWRVNGYAIEDCASPTTPIAGLNYVDDESEAAGNARLIAAAPDLLAALTAYVAFQHGGKINPNPECGERLCADARAAIAKARGETVVAS